MTPAVHTYRRDPKPGTVVTIPIGSDGFAYVLSISSATWWLYDFVTDHPTCSADQFDIRHLKLPMFLMGRLITDYRDVCQITLPEDNRLTPWMPGGPKVVRIISEEQRTAGNRPTRYMVGKPGGGYDYVSEDEAAMMFRDFHLGSPEEISAFLQQMLPQLRRVQVPEAERWVPQGRSDKHAPKQHPPSLITVYFYEGAEETIGEEAEDICEILATDLDAKDLGLLMTMDSFGEEGSQFQAVLEIPHGKEKAALTQIRKTLKRIKAPPTTRIIESSETRTIEHPLVAASKAK